MFFIQSVLSSYLCYRRRVSIMRKTYKSLSRHTLYYTGCKKRNIGHACCNGVNMGLHPLTITVKFASLLSTTTTREDENKLHETSISFYTKHFPSISFSQTHICTNTQQTNYMCSKQQKLFLHTSCTWMSSILKHTVLEI